MTASKNRNGSRVTVACLSLAVHRQCTATQTVSSSRRGMTVPRNSLARYYRQGLRGINAAERLIRRCCPLQRAQSCATRSCCACVDLITYMWQRWLTCEQVLKNTEEKSSAVPPFPGGSHIGNLRPIREAREGRVQRGRKNAGCLPFCPRGGRHPAFPASADGESPLRFSEKLSPGKGEHAAAVRSAPVRKGRPVQKRSSAPARCRRAAPSG